MTEGELNTGGFGTKKNIQKLKNLSVDTNDSSSSSRFSVDSQKPRTRPPSGTYVVELPKEKIFRVPPPENAVRYEYLSKRKRKQSNCRRCFWYSLAGLLLILFLIAIIVGVLYLVYRPHKPQFSVTEISVTGMNLTLSSRISPGITVKLRSENVNNKLGLIFEKGNEAEVFYEGIKLGNGEFTEFKQAANNVAVIVTVLKGSSIQLTSWSRKKLKELEKKGEVPFGLGFKAPVKFSVGSVTTWTLTVTVDCKVTVDKLTASATVVTETCDTGLRLM